MNKVTRGSLLGIEEMEAAEIAGLLKLADRMNPLKPRPVLRGKKVLLLSMKLPHALAARLKLRPSRWVR